MPVNLVHKGEALSYGHLDSMMVYVITGHVTVADLVPMFALERKVIEQFGSITFVVVIKSVGGHFDARVKDALLENMRGVIQTKKSVGIAFVFQLEGASMAGILAKTAINVLFIQAGRLIPRKFKQHICGSVEEAVAWSKKLSRQAPGIVANQDLVKDIQDFVALVTA
jgi:hypothetical protein